MQGILDILDFFVTTVRSIYGFFSDIVSSLVLLMTYVLRALALASQCIMSMPVWLQAFGFVTLGVSVLYLVLGREGGKSNG